MNIASSIKTSTLNAIPFRIVKESMINGNGGVGILLILPNFTACPLILWTQFDNSRLMITILSIDNNQIILCEYWVVIYNSAVATFIGQICHISIFYVFTHIRLLLIQTDVLKALAMLLFLLSADQEIDFLTIILI